MFCNETYKYISRKIHRPFFYVVGDQEYKSVLNELASSGFEIIRTSDFCLRDDKFPDIDGLINSLMNTSKTCRVVIGLGEFLALKGDMYISNILHRVNELSSHVIFLLRCCTEHVNAMISSDLRIKEQGRYFISSNTFSELVVINSTNFTPRGVKFLLRNFEDGVSGECFVNSEFTFKDSSLKICRGSYEALCYLETQGKIYYLEQEIGTIKQWDMLLEDFLLNDKNLDKVFCEKKINADNPEKILGNDFYNWLRFIYLKIYQDKLVNSYLRYVIAHTKNFRDFHRNLFTAILNISAASPKFERFYVERKAIVKSFSEHEVLSYIKAFDFNSDETILFLTDSTSAEREAVINHYCMLPQINKNFPILGAYMSSYIFPEEYLCEYFDRYKTQKIMNKYSEDFLKLSERYAGEARYTEFETRDNVMHMLTGDNNFLLWIDALGVEYLSLIKFLAVKKNIDIEIHIARSNLPTITEINKKFFDDWPDDMKRKESGLDDIKHNDIGDKFLPGYLALELDVIVQAVDEAYLQLSGGLCRKFIIAGDHGASRPALISRRDEKYECRTKGEHSGRCCKYFEECEISHKVVENNYIILTDYGNFKGSRIIGRELHGGATLEEVLVPVVVLSLKSC